jgi:nucleoside-diphosphate-sugar epimerase
VGKLAAEGYCRSFWEVYGLETVALRYFNTFGPRQDPLSQYAAVIPKFVTVFLTGGTPVVFGDGEQSRDFTYVENVVEANLLAASAPGVAGCVFNIASGRSLSVNDLLERLRELTGRDVEAQYAEPRPGEVRHSQADVSAAHTELAYRPTVSFEEGLERTIADLESRLNRRPEQIALS